MSRKYWTLEENNQGRHAQTAGAGHLSFEPEDQRPNDARKLGAHIVKGEEFGAPIFRDHRAEQGSTESLRSAPDDAYQNCQNPKMQGSPDEERLMTMFRAVGLNVKLKLVEVGVLRPYRYKPFPKTGPFISQNQHDNNKGDAAFSVFNFYHCNAVQTHICDKKLDDLIEKAQVASGEERRSLWRAAFKRIHEDIIPDVMLFHMVGYTRVGKRINYKPTIATNSEIQLAHITFKK